MTNQHERALSFVRLRQANIDRWIESNGSTKDGRAAIKKHCCELAFALGRAAARFHTDGARVDPDDVDLADALAEIVIHADLIAGLSKIRLAETIVRRFDEQSAAQSAPVYIHARPRARKEKGES